MRRRQFLGTLGFAAAAASLHSRAAFAPPRYRIAVCDWMILKRQKIGAFPLAREIGADGVEVDLGPLGERETFDNQLRDPAVARQFSEAARAAGVAISSVAMSGFYAQSFAERLTVDRMVSDCLETMDKLAVRVAFLPLGVQGDLTRRPEIRPAIVARLRAAGRRAEAAGLVIGIETSLPAAEEVRLLEEIGSSAVRIYFNFANPLQAGRDLALELRTLGRDRICQIHCTDTDGLWLQDNPRLDLRAVRATLDGMGWSGWLVVERSRSARDPRNVRANFGANVSYLKSIFAPA